MNTIVEECMCIVNGWFTLKPSCFETNFANISEFY